MQPKFRIGQAVLMGRTLSGRITDIFQDPNSGKFLYSLDGACGRQSDVAERRIKSLDSIGPRVIGRTGINYGVSHV